MFFFIQKLCPKSNQNDPKIDPSASQGGVWLPGFIRSSLDMPFLRFLMLTWLPKWLKNDPVEPPMVPRTIKISNFPPKGRFGGVLVPAVIFGEPIWCHFGRFWPYSRKFVACVLNSFSSMWLFPKNWGGEGGGKHSFLDHTLQHQTFLQHQNLWLARCGFALQLG